MTATPAIRPMPSRTGSAQVLDEQERRMNMEIDQLLIDIRRIGPTHPDPSPNVLFGELFDDDGVQQYYEALVGTLKCAKKRGVISFRGQMLLKGIHDDTLISIVEDAASMKEHGMGSISRSTSLSASALAKTSSRRITPRIVTPKLTTPLIKTPTVYSKSAQKANQISSRCSARKTPRSHSARNFSPKKFTFASPQPTDLSIKENEKFDIINSSSHSDQIKDHSDGSDSLEKASDQLDLSNTSDPSDQPKLTDPSLSDCLFSDRSSKTPVSQVGLRLENNLSPCTPSTGAWNHEKSTKSASKSATKLSSRKSHRSRHSTGANLGRDAMNPAWTKGDSPTGSNTRVTPGSGHSIHKFQRNLQCKASFRTPQPLLHRAATMPLKKLPASSRELSLRNHSDDIALRTEDEVHRILYDIRRVGLNPGEPTVKFGELFDDEEVQNTYEALNGTLRSAKRQGLIVFKGQMLLKGMHDHVVISVVE